MNLILLSTMSMIITMLLYMVNTFMKTKPDINKMSPYECGFDPLGDARSPISIQFFLVAILFILFDLEIILLLPIPWSMNSNSPIYTFTMMSIFLITLTIGLLYEWQQGGLEWSH
uniref:NADH-ubiquinone oxidoreductase chain 3 n=1 Tax=Acrochordus granulatus TaxID=46287 RepID=Q402M4_ACRGR|nr:NADH dehydrogenase subunit 3 [Acrochordus granulatus]BAE20021.1 NADH dehydrogenase subunit 3 [Acrochordus granulatus]